MKILITSFAHRTHFQGLVPVAWALTAAGHQVRVASQPELTPAITSAGLTAAPVGVDHRLFEIDPAEAATVHRYSTGLDFSTRHDELHSWEFLLGLEAANARSVFPRVNNDEFVAGLVDHALHWRPDLVLWEPFTFAGAIAARACGAAHARLSWGTDLTGYFRSQFLARRAERPDDDRPDPLADWLAEVAGRFDVEPGPDLAVGEWTIDQVPSRFRLSTGLDTIASVLVPYNGPSEVPDWLTAVPGGRIAVTGGFSGLGDTDDLRSLVRGLADLDREVVVTRSGLASHEVPASTRLVDFVPMNALLETCDVVLHHGGAGSWSSALHRGVPQVTVAHEWDCLLRGQQVAQAGAGLSIDPSTADPTVLRDAVATVLADPGYADAAERLRLEARAEPGPLDVVHEIERRVADRHAGP